MTNRQAKEYSSLTAGKLAITLENWDRIFGDEFRNQSKLEIIGLLLANITYGYANSINIDLSSSNSGEFAADTIISILKSSSTESWGRLEKSKYLARYRSHPGLKSNPEESKKLVAAFIALAANAKEGPFEEAATCFIEMIIGYVYYLYSCDALTSIQEARAEVYLTGVANTFGLGGDFIQEVSKARSRNSETRKQNQEVRISTHRKTKAEAVRPTQGLEIVRDRREERNKEKRSLLLARKANIQFASTIVALLWFALGMGLPAYYSWTSSDVTKLIGLLVVPLISLGSSALINGLVIPGIAIIGIGSYVAHQYSPNGSEWFVYTAVGVLTVWFVTRLAPSISRDIDEELVKLGRP
jgi:hypothetical protein